MKMFLFVPTCVALVLSARGTNAFAFRQHHHHHLPSRNVALAASVETTTTTEDLKPKTSYGHLFRHFEDISVDCWLRCCSPTEFLLATGFTENEIEAINDQYPRLMELNVHDQLAPKIRFLINALGAGHGTLEWATDNEDKNDNEAAPSNIKTAQDIDEECNVNGEDTKWKLKMQVSDLGKQAVPFDLLLQSLLDRTVGPRHAYLMHSGLPHGNDLLLNKGEYLRQFLKVCNGKASKSDFLNICVLWGSRHIPPMGGSVTSLETYHTLERLEAFEESFRNGLIPAAQNIHTPALHTIQSTPGHFVELLLSHGANYRDPDDEHNSALHWAAGSGNFQAAKALLNASVENGDQTAEEVLMYTQSGKDGATPLHWACCGIRNVSKGHEDICRLFLTSPGRDQSIELVNAATWTGNTALMFAAWSGSLDTAKLLVNHGADPHFHNHMGCSAAHFAASGGRLPICQYLHNEFGVDFFQPNENGDSALDYAIAQDHRAVVDWMKEILSAKSSKGDVDESCKSTLDRSYSSTVGASDVSRRQTMLECLDLPTFNAIAP